MNLEGFLLLGAGLVAIGLWGTLAQRTFVMMLLGIELMLNGVLVSTVALWHYVAAYSAKGLVFSVLVLSIVALQAALGCALLVGFHRVRRSAAAQGYAQPWEQRGYGDRESTEDAIE